MGVPNVENQKELTHGSYVHLLWLRGLQVFKFPDSIFVSFQQKGTFIHYDT